MGLHPMKLGTIEFFIYNLGHLALSLEDDALKGNLASPSFLNDVRDSTKVISEFFSTKMKSSQIWLLGEVHDEMGLLLYWFDLAQSYALGRVAFVSAVEL